MQRSGRLTRKERMGWSLEKLYTKTMTPLTPEQNKRFEEFIEKGADLEHERWARWQKYMFTKMIPDATGDFYLLPKSFWEHWNRQIDTPYSLLSEEEKESDRKETRNYLPLLEEQLSLARSTLIQEIEGMRLTEQSYGKWGTSYDKYNQAIDDILHHLKQHHE